jgi:hypothetical protein
VFRRGIVALAGAAAISAVLVLGGCGSGDDSGTTSAEGSGQAVVIKSTSMSKGQYQKQAKKICTEEIDKVIKVVRKAVGTGDPVKVAVVLPPIEGIRDRLVSLGAPQGEEQQAEQFIAALDEGLEKAKGSDSAGTEELASDFKKSGELAVKTGIIACRLG